MGDPEEAELLKIAKRLSEQLKQEKDYKQKLAVQLKNRGYSEHVITNLFSFYKVEMEE